MAIINVVEQFFFSQLHILAFIVSGLRYATC